MFDADHHVAANALMTMNKRQCLGRELRVNWATAGAGSQAPRPDTSKHFHIFVGDLSAELDTPQLQDAFSPFGEISDCRVVRDPHTLKSRGYGFVSFVRRTDAENAIGTMNGQWLGSRAIRTNWATRKLGGPGLPGTGGHGAGSNGPSSSHAPTQSSGKQLNYDEVYAQSGPTNSTVYCGNLANGTNEQQLQSTFSQFGPIFELRLFKDKGYAFIKFLNKESAANAICQMHSQEINGQSVKCSWGKESDGSLSNAPGTATGAGTAAAAAAAGGTNTLANQQYAYSYPYWGYTQGYAHPMPAQAFAGQFAAPVQPAAVGQMQAYAPYAQYYAAASSPANFNALMAWQAAAASGSLQTNASSNGISGTGNSSSNGGQSALSQSQSNGTVLGNNSSVVSQSTSNHNQSTGQPIIGSYPMQSYQAQ